jgi:glycosyltransferase involved in cell wall biosynthesis
MACRKAIIASNKVGCAVDLVVPGKNGDIFEAGNANDLTKKLRLLLKNKAILKQMGQASAGIIKDWDFKTQVEAIEAGLNAK